MVLIFITEFAIIAFFGRRRQPRTAAVVWRTAVALALGVVGMGTVLFLATTNFTTMTGGSVFLAALLRVALWAVFPVGVVLAVYDKKRRPAVYQGIGRHWA